jgi:hypothetical protein
MHSAVSRANAVFAYATTALFILTGWIAFTSTLKFLVPEYFPSLTPVFVGIDEAQFPMSLNVSWVKLVRPTRKLHYHWHSFYHTPQHYGVVEFNLTTDFRPLFRWNTQQVFAMITLEYDAAVAGTLGNNTESKEPSRNSKDPFKKNKITIWDSIITKPEDAQVMISRTSNKYGITDVRYRRENRLDGMLATLRLEWCIHTCVGPVHCGQMSDDKAPTFVFPEIGSEAVDFDE